MNIEIKIVKDENVLELLNDKVFVSQWEELAIQSDHATVIQEPPFVITWYRQYTNRYQPILILGFDKKNILIGLIPLAYSLKGHYLTHAGDGQAEYHGWLCKESEDHDFMIQALIAIKSSFKIRKWLWRSLPPGSRIGCLSSSELKKEQIFISITEEDSPVLDLNDISKIERIKKNKSTQNQLNRYKKRNGFCIERITSREKAEKIFDVLSKQCDIRQMASHRTTPFANDGNKKKFYLERLNFPENNHFTVLWSDKTPVAFHFGACDSKTVYNGLSAYNPVEEKNSPGRILIIKLAELLREEGFQYFDLTPGGDKYKEKYSSFNQKIYTISIFFFRKEKIIHDIKYILVRSLKKGLLLFGVDPRDAKFKLNDALAILKKISRVSPLETIRKFVSRVYERNYYLFYKLLSEDIPLNNFHTESGISINNYSDLLLYSESNPWISKTDLFRRAFKHFLSEDLLYTFVLNGVLVQYGWVAKSGKSQELKKIEIEAEFDSPENSYILYDFYTEPNFSIKEIFSETLEKMLIDCRKKGAKEVCVWLSDKKLSSLCGIESTGFKIYRKFQRRKTLGLVQKKVIS